MEETCNPCMRIFILPFSLTLPNSAVPVFAATVTPVVDKA